MGMARTVRMLLVRAREAGVERLDAQQLLTHALQRPRSWLLAHEDDVLPDGAANAFEADLARCASGEPLAYIVGEREFHGLMLQVDPRVLVPRPDTETLVDWAIELLAGQDAPAVADLGTGSGAIALALKRALPATQVTATDRSPDALSVAMSNGARLGLDVRWLAGDWWHALPADERYDLVASNPPYIVDGDPHLAPLAHEPIDALTSGPDGLEALREIVAGAVEHLAPGGWLVLEHGYDQADAVRRLLAARGFQQIQSRRDLSGIERCSGGRTTSERA